MRLKNKTKGYSIVNNDILKDARVNMRDRGMYATLCSLPDGWELSIKGLTKILPEGKQCITSSLNSLEELGYLKRKQKRVRGRMMGTEWEITVPQEEENGGEAFVNRTQGYTVVKNDILVNTELSLKDRGTLVTLLALPTGWKLSITGLANMLPDGTNAVGKSLNRLEELGYLKRKQKRGEDGKWGECNWEVFDEQKEEDKEEVKTIEQKEKKEDKKLNTQENQRMKPSLKIRPGFHRKANRKETDDSS